MFCHLMQNKYSSSDAELEQKLVKGFRNEGVKWHGKIDLKWSGSETKAREAKRANGQYQKRRLAYFGTFYHDPLRP